MNVLIDGIIFTRQARGGISRIYHEILPRICEIRPDCQMTIFVQGVAKQPIPSHHNIETIELPGRQIRGYVSSLKDQIFARFGEINKNRNLKPYRDWIWHSTYYSMPTQWKGPKVITIHDLAYEKYPEIYKGKAFDAFRSHIRRCIEAADVLICVSRATEDELRNYYDLNQKRTEVVHNGYSSIFHKIDSSQADVEKPFILYLGKRGNYKNFQSLARAFGGWKNRFDVDLLCVGPTWNQQEKHFMEDMGIAENVRLESNVTDEQLCELYNRARFFVYPSLHEGFGIPLLEAMACGCPVAASDIPVFREVGQDGPLYFDPQSEEHMRTVFDSLYQEGRNTQRCSRGMEISKQYSWDHTAKKITTIYESLS